MYSEYANNMSELNAIGLKAAKQCGSLQVKAHEMWAAHQRTLAQAYIDNGLKFVADRPAVGNLGEAVSGFSQMLSGMNEQAISNNLKAIELAAEVSDGFKDWAKTNLEEVAAVFKTDANAPAGKAEAKSPATKNA